MHVPITALYLAIFALFAAGLYVMCGRIRGSPAHFSYPPLQRLVRPRAPTP